MIWSPSGPFTHMALVMPYDGDDALFTGGDVFGQKSMALASTANKSLAKVLCQMMGMRHC
jgi:hypothetical protein